MSVQAVLSVATLMLISFPALGQNAKKKPKPVEQATPFSKLVAEFDQAEALKIDDVGGYYNGRCFESANKSVVLPGLLVYLDAEVGPNFPDLKPRYVYRYSRYVIPDAFEHLDTEKEQKDLVKATLDELAAMGSTPAKEEQKGLTYTDSFNGTRKPAFRIELRKNGNLFFAKTTSVASGDMQLRSMNQRLNFEPGQVWEICYYYQQILTKAEVDKLR